MTGIRVVLFCLFCALAVLTAGPGQAKRLALVIGVDAYQNVTPLQKAANDARAVGHALQRSGFEVLSRIDPSRTEFLLALNDLYNRIDPGDEVVFFFAGHGVQLDGRNRLLPANVPQVAPGNELLLEEDSFGADQIMERIQQRGARLTFMILDACRNNPFPTQGQRSVGGARGLARMEPAEGAFILYSAGAGQTALDRLSNADSDPNSVFTRSLLPLMEQPGLALPTLARKVRDDVRELARSVNHNQFPAYYDQLSGDFYIRPGTADPDRGAFSVTASPAPPPADPPAPGDPCAGAEGMWTIIQTSESQTVFEEFRKRYGECGIYSALALEQLNRLKGGIASSPADSTAQTRPVAAAPPQPVRPAAPVPSGDACFDLWYQRNAVFQAYGYCFQTEKAKRYFDTSACSTRSPRLSAADLSRVEAIRARERAAGC